MFPSALCFLLSVTSALALYETDFYVCENKYITWKTERIFAATLCDFKHGFIGRGNEFVTATKHGQISITAVENLVLARDKACGDKETKRHFVSLSSTDSDSHGVVIRNSDGDNLIKEYDLSRSKSTAKKTVVYNGKLWAEVADVGSNSGCLTCTAPANFKGTTPRTVANNQRATNGKQVEDLIGVRFYRALWTQAMRKQRNRRRAL